MNKGKITDMKEDPYGSSTILYQNNDYREKSGGLGDYQNTKSGEENQHSLHQNICQSTWY